MSSGSSPRGAGLFGLALAAALVLARKKRNRAEEG
jgi:MYXO-CTERM domain-containing protein